MYVIVLIESVTQLIFLCCGIWVYCQLIWELNTNFFGGLQKYKVQQW